MTRVISRTGVHLSDLKMGPKEGMSSASRLGYRILEVGASAGEISPEQLSDSGKRHVQRYARGLGLTIAALDAHPGEAGFADSTSADQCVQRTRRILELAAELKVPVVTTSIGRLQVDDARQIALVREALAQVGEHADIIGLPVALETAIAPQALATLLKDIDCPYLKVCYDPGELLMDGYDAMAPAEDFADNLALSYIRDAKVGAAGQRGRETNLGLGHLNVPVYLGQLEQVGYNGPLIVRRTGSDQPLADLKSARTYLESIQPPEP